MTTREFAMGARRFLLVCVQIVGPFLRSLGLLGALPPRIRNAVSWAWVPGKVRAARIVKWGGRVCPNEVGGNGIERGHIANSN